jgi:hypothetical protein
MTSDLLAKVNLKNDATKEDNVSEFNGENNTITTIDKSESIVEVEEVPLAIPLVPSYVPHGTYTATSTGQKLSITFKDNNILETSSMMDGKRVYQYEISDSGSRIYLEDIMTKEKASWSFKYNKDIDCVALTIGHMSFLGKLLYYK